MGKPTVSTILGMVFAWLTTVPVMAEEAKTVRKSPAPLESEAVSLTDAIAKNSIETGDLVVQHNACIGSSCSTSDANFSALKLKSVAPNILFDDIEAPEGGSSSSHDWALFVNFNEVDQFSIVDFSNGQLPINIAAGAPTDSLDVAANGNVGLGTASPTAQLYLLGQGVTGSANTTKIVVDNNSTTGGDREMLELRNNGGPVSIFRNMASGARWAVGAPGTDFWIDNQATATAIEFRLFSGGNLTIGGTLSQGSSRAIKENVRPVDGREILARVAALPIGRWSYKSDEQQAPHLGPFSEDFQAAFGLGGDASKIAVVDAEGVALAAIQGLYSLVLEKEAKLEKVVVENHQLAERLAKLEAMLQSLGAQAGAAVLAKP